MYSKRFPKARVECSFEYGRFLSIITDLKYKRTNQVADEILFAVSDSTFFTGAVRNICTVGLHRR